MGGRFSLGRVVADVQKVPVIVSGITSSKIVDAQTFFQHGKFHGYDFWDRDRLVTGQIASDDLRQKLKPTNNDPIFLDELGIEDIGITATELKQMRAFELTGTFKDCAVAKALRRIQDRPTVGGAAGAMGGSGGASGGEEGRKRSRSESGSRSVTPEPATSKTPSIPGKKCCIVIE